MVLLLVVRLCSAGQHIMLPWKTFFVVFSNLFLVVACLQVICIFYCMYFPRSAESHFFFKYDNRPFVVFRVARPPRLVGEVQYTCSDTCGICHLVHFTSRLSSTWLLSIVTYISLFSNGLPVIPFPINLTFGAVTPLFLYLFIYIIIHLLLLFYFFFSSWASIRWI